MNNRGLSLIEVVVALLVLTVGLLGLAAGTGFVIRSTEVARVDTNRAAAIQSGIEALRAVPFADVGTDTREIGAFTISWSQLDSATDWRLMQIIVDGPGRTPGGGTGLQGLSTTAVDTVTYRLIRP